MEKIDLNDAHFLHCSFPSVLYVCVCVCACVLVSSGTTKDRIVCDLYTLSFDERYYTNRQRGVRGVPAAHFFYSLLFGKLAHSHQTKRQTPTFGGGNEAIAMKWKCIQVCLSRCSFPPPLPAIAPPSGQHPLPSGHDQIRMRLQIRRAR